jgi:hypothetical protein
MKRVVLLSVSPLVELRSANYGSGGTHVFTCVMFGRPGPETIKCPGTALYYLCSYHPKNCLL